jgi:hypothetical protein
MANPWTAGPWEYVGYQDGEEGSGWFVRIAPHRVVLVEGRTASEADANARLLAAAPEMADELQEILDWAVREKAPLREQEIASIRTLLSRIRGDTP